MYDKLIPYMRCAICSGTELSLGSNGVYCGSCGKLFPLRSGVLDMIPNDSAEVITPFQRLMQSSVIASIYEKMWRRIGYFLASSRSFNREIKTVLRMAENKDRARTLDLACGPGIFARPLARHSSGIYIGLDLSKAMLNQAQRSTHKEGMDNLSFIRATAFRLPFVDAAFTYVNCCGALHLFDRPDAALDEVARVLSPGGHFCVQTTIRPARSAGFAFFLEKFIRFGFFDEAELRRKITARGFSVIESERHRISFTFLAQSRKNH
jgi:ubiquinone/menaquinone biosynthesis C-methylase UbiE